MGSKFFSWVKHIMDDKSVSRLEHWRICDLLRRLNLDSPFGVQVKFCDRQKWRQQLHCFNAKSEAKQPWLVGEHEWDLGDRAHWLQNRRSSPLEPEPKDQTLHAWTLPKHNSISGGRLLILFVRKRWLK